MAEPETIPEDPPVPDRESEPAIPGAPIGVRTPDAVAEPIPAPDIPALQDRRRPLP